MCYFSAMKICLILTMTCCSLQLAAPCSHQLAAPCSLLLAALCRLQLAAHYSNSLQRESQAFSLIEKSSWSISTKLNRSKTPMSNSGKVGATWRSRWELR